MLDIDSTIKPLYGRQEGAMVGYNPQKPGRPSHCYHTYLMANLRLVLGVDVQPGDKHTSKHGQAGLWSLLHRLGRSRWPALLRGAMPKLEPVLETVRRVRKFPSRIAFGRGAKLPYASKAILDSLRSHGVADHVVSPTRIPFTGAAA